MQIADYYAIAQNHGHDIYYLPLKESQSLSIQENGKCYIALSAGQDERLEKQNLAHELGHCEYGGFYNIHSPYDIRSRVENRANRWAYVTALPLDEIRKAIKAGNHELWELADYFDVTPEFMENGLRFYAEQLGIRIMGQCDE